MKNWTIGKRITLGFAAVLFIMLALGGLTHERLRTVQEETTSIIGDSIPSLKMLATVQLLTEQNARLTYQHISSTTEEDMNKLEVTIKENSGTVAKTLTDYEKISSPECKRLLEPVQAARIAFVNMREHILVLSHGATNAEQTAEVYRQARTQMDPVALVYLDALTKAQEQEEKEVTGCSDNVLAAVRSAKTSLIIGVAIALIFGSVLAFVITSSTTRILTTVSSALNDGSNQVASAAGQVSSASQSLAEGSGQQAASIEESSSSLEELSSMTKRNSENAQKANDLAKEARHAADKGVGDMQTMVTAMEAIKVSSDDIAKIIKTIDEIAFQTNILALNAAVEAARAGEAGMGFAVVADEVRNLAQRCAQAAKETSGKIEGAIVKTGQGVDISGKVAAALNEIVTKVRQVDELVTEVAGASREQTQGITQINVAVAQMDKVTQSNAATAEESAAAAEELNAQAETMKQSVAELLQLVGGKGGTSPLAHARRPQMHAAKAVVKHIAPLKNRNGNGNGHAAPAMTIDKRRNEIPLEGDFKDF